MSALSEVRNATERERGRRKATAFRGGRPSVPTVRAGRARRLAVFAAVVALLLTACGPRFDSDDVPTIAIGNDRPASEDGPQDQPGVPTTGPTSGGQVGALPTAGTGGNGNGGIGGGKGAVVRGGVVKVGGLFPLTGGLSALGTPAFQGAQAYFNYLNSKGGIGGKKIQFVVCDDQADDTRSTTCAKKLVEQDGVFMMGPSFTPFSLTVINQLRSAGVPWVGYDGINVEGFSAENVVTIGSPIETMEHGLLPYWWDKVKRETGSPPQKLGVVVLDSGPAQTYLREAEDVMCPRLGCQIVRTAEVGYTTTQYGTICRSMQSQNVDAVWIITDPASAIKLLVQCQAAGYKPPKGFLGQHGIYLDLTLRQAGKFADGILSNSALVPDTVDNPATREMKKIIRTYYPNAEMGYFTTLAYASARMVADVIEGALDTGKELTRSEALGAAAKITSYDCHGLCKGVNLAPPAARTGGNHNIWIVRADFSQDSKGRWVYEAGPIEAYSVRTWPCPGKPRPC
ncbi:MAG TPA: ABC transporter substrate-binding protein [Actinomycetota bacterium]|nr:ABC transporter substrate-binding protein [Actinomycetota bacterium]